MIEHSEAAAYLAAYNEHHGTSFRLGGKIASGGTASTGHQVGLNASQVRIEAMTDGRGSVQTQVEDGRFIATVRLPVAA